MNNWYIYKIINNLNGKCYIGQRKHESKNDGYLGSGTAIKHAIKKYGKDNFSKIILKDNIKCQTAADIFEMVYIKRENTLIPNGYNIQQGGLRPHTTTKGRVSPMKGKKHTEEAKRKIGEHSKGNHYGLGYKHTEESKRKIGEHSIGNKNCLGKKLTGEHIEKIKQSNLGRKCSEETKIKISNKLKNRIIDDEWKKKISESKKGIKITEEHIEILRQSRLGKTHSEETIHKMSESKKGKWSEKILKGWETRRKNKEKNYGK